MAIPAGTVRVSLTGNLFGGEIFNVSHWFADPVGTDNVPSDNTEAAAVLTTITSGANWTSYLSALAAMLRAGCAYNAVTLYSYPNGGPSATAQATKSVVGTGTSTLGTLPNQIARVVTLRSDFSGRSNRGRVYLPATGLAMDSTTGLFSANPSGLLTAMGAWLDNWFSDPGWLPVVVSPTKTTWSTIRSLKTDQRPDVQRRRAAKEAVGTIYTLDGIGP